MGSCVGGIINEVSSNILVHNFWFTCVYISDGNGIAGS